MNTKIERRTWKEFQELKLLWWINRFLHVFGWVIMVSEDSKTGEIVDAFPARTKWRGFMEEEEDLGFQKLTEYMANNSAELLSDISNGG